MKVLIYYFTGTGNSLFVARKIAQRLGGAVLKPVKELIWSGDNEVCTDPILLDADAVGFVFPVYFDRIPEIILKAIEKSYFKNTQYFFAATTSGEGTENALFELNSVLRSRGVRLDYGKNIVMSDNSIVLKTSENKADKRLKRTDEIADEIAAAVNKFTKIDGAFQHSSYSSFIGKIGKLIFVNYYKADKRKVDMSRCNQCGMCAKLCPAGNISMAEGEMKIGDHCQWCFACLNWCPQKAIRFGRIDPSKRHQYHCPSIKASDI